MRRATSIRKLKSFHALVISLFLVAAASGEELNLGDRSPVDLVLSRDERSLLVLNRTAGTVATVSLPAGMVTHEIAVGRVPSNLVLAPDEKRALVSCTADGTLVVLSRDESGWKRQAVIDVGREPRGIAVTRDGKLACVALSIEHAIAIVDLDSLVVVDRVAVGRWPRELALSPDNTRLAVGVNGDGGIAVVDLPARKQLFIEDFLGINLGQMECSPDGKYVYFPWMVYRRNPITPSNIREGWVLASRIARVRLDEHVRRDAISLDPKGEAVCDPHGLALSSDGQTIVTSAAGSQELIVLQLPGLPFKDYGGPGDHIDAELLKDSKRFFRIPLGGRPLAVRLTRDGATAYVANYMHNSVQVVDLRQRKVARVIPLGGEASPSLVRRGEAIFYDGKRSLDQWYSCHTCHFEGGSNAVTMDTKNDGTSFTFKAVPSLKNVVHTPPWTWHGWQTDLRDAIRTSITQTMLGPEPAEQDVVAVEAFLARLNASPTIDFRSFDEPLKESRERGKALFEGKKGACRECHRGPHFTDEGTYDVGTGTETDAYEGYNPPTLLGVGSKVRFLHDGRARSLREVMIGSHLPSKVRGVGELTDAEMTDLLNYLDSL
ncbi:MAG: cytochrome c peroxidase [Planctomycetota bacterium]